MPTRRSNIPFPRMEAVPRARLPLIPEPENSLRARRRRGESLCSRQRSEREIVEDRIKAAQEAQNEVFAAEEDVEETKRMLAEGLILADGSQAPPKRKRPSSIRPPGPKKSLGGNDGGGGEAEQARKRMAVEVAEKEAAKKTKAEEKEAKAAAKVAEKEAAQATKLAEKDAKKKAANANANSFEAGAVVEVSLRLGEAYANWYEARLLENNKGRWRLALQRRVAEGDWEPLLLEGRPATEWAKPDMLRPLPGKGDWHPTVDDHCGAPRAPRALPARSPRAPCALALCDPRSSASPDLAPRLISRLV